VHERSQDTDIMLGLLKEEMKKNLSLRVIVMSATMDITQVSYQFLYQYLADVNDSYLYTSALCVIPERYLWLRFLQSECIRFLRNIAM
jgi:hypothetical protein